MVLDILIKDAKEAEQLNLEATKIDDILWVHADDGRIMVDARSLIGLYALVNIPSKLVAEDNANPMTLSYVAKKSGVNID